jgi:hypothetical protein
MASRDSEPPSDGRTRNGSLRIPLPFDEAVKAALELTPPPKKPRKPRTKKSANRQPRPLRARQIEYEREAAVQANTPRLVKLAAVPDQAGLADGQELVAQDRAVVRQLPRRHEQRRTGTSCARSRPCHAARGSTAYASTAVVDDRFSLGSISETNWESIVYWTVSVPCIPAWA